MKKLLTAVLASVLLTSCGVTESELPSLEVRGMQIVSMLIPVKYLISRLFTLEIALRVFCSYLSGIKMSTILVKVLLSLRKKKVTNMMVNIEMNVCARKAVIELNASVNSEKLKMDLIFSIIMSSIAKSLSIVGKNSCM